MSSTTPPATPDEPAEQPAAPEAPAAPEQPAAPEAPEASEAPAPETAAPSSEQAPPAPPSADAPPTPYAAPASEQPAPAPYGGAPAAPSQTLSILALVFGILGAFLSLFAFGFLPALAGVILGHLALKREPHARGMGLAGLITGYVGIAISIIWAIVFVIPFLALVVGLGAFSTGGF